MAIVVAIDGPAGAGKSTVARAVARELGYVYVDTGALYRAIGWAARDAGIALDEESAVAALAARLRLEFLTGEDGASRIQVDGVDRAAEIRTPEVADAASKVSQYAGVRDALLASQRAMGVDGGVVLEGRDIGTVVFPDAALKVFLTASPEVRANRRYAELLQRGHEVEYEALLAAIRERDERDTLRPIAPLKEAEDAVRVDSSALGPQQVVGAIVELARERE